MQRNKEQEVIAASLPPDSDSNYRSAGGRLKAIATVILIIGGGIGNLIDRIFRGFVIDYLSLSFFPPICNFADYCITIGAVLFVLKKRRSPISLSLSGTMRQ